MLLKFCLKLSIVRIKKKNESYNTLLRSLSLNFLLDLLWLNMCDYWNLKTSVIKR